MGNASTNDSRTNFEWIQCDIFYKVGLPKLLKDLTCCKGKILCRECDKTLRNQGKCECPFCKLPRETVTLQYPPESTLVCVCG